ncbi:MAG: glutamate 5-kinase [Acidimicrobiia bacterium]|nr:glutamate 5-kinase [Acidimicrobiia bacterium]
MTTRRPAPTGQPVVVKVGSSSLASVSGGLDHAALRSVVDQVVELWSLGHPTVLVSSGAVAAGLLELGRDRRPADVPDLQVAAAVGQGRLMERYATEFGALGRLVGQVLLTKDVLANRGQYLHARQALDRMLALGIVPVVNENDTVVVDELRIGDNDRLAAIVSHLVGAALLVLLTDTAGLYSEDPRLESEVELLTAVKHTDQILDLLAAGRSGPMGSGGVATKVAAARMAAWSGVPTVIAGSQEPRVAVRAAAGDPVGTWIEPHGSRLPSRKLWIAFGQPAEGSLWVDGGAAAAILSRGSSLLPVGITEIRGSFDEGAAVEVFDPAGNLVGKGLVTVSSKALAPLLGRHSTSVPMEGWGGEVIHRDDLVILVDSTGSIS